MLKGKKLTLKTIENSLINAISELEEALTYIKNLQQKGE